MLGDRPAAVVRELTKLHEEARRGTLPELAEFYVEAPKGEIVLVIGGAAMEVLSENDLADRLRAALRTQSMRDAASLVAEATGEPRKKLYELALTLAKEKS